MTSVSDLQPGDLVTHSGMSAVFITRTPHPAWPALELVVWRLDDGTPSFDALAAAQDVGQVAPSTAAQRSDRLVSAVQGEFRA
jgi:hypothetical protein